MIDYISIRNAIVQGLRDYSGYKVIVKDQAKPKKLPYPYYGIKITAPQSNTPDRNDEDYSYNAIDDLIDYESKMNVEIVISIDAFSKDQFECYNVINKAVDYFKSAGYDELSYQGITVVGLTDPINRNLLIQDLYEYRNGFDLTIRVFNTVARSVVTIETVNVTKE